MHHFVSLVKAFVQTERQNGQNNNDVSSTDVGAAVLSRKRTKVLFNHRESFKKLRNRKNILQEFATEFFYSAYTQCFFYFIFS